MNSYNKIILPSLLVLGVLISIIPYSWMSTWSGLIFNAMHFPAFVILGLVLKNILERRKSPFFHLIWVLPVFIELIQVVVGRSADIVDLFWGYLGLIVGMNFKSLASILTLLSSFIYLVWVGYLILYAYTPFQRLPLIADFESGRDFWFIQSIGQTPQDNLKVTLSPSVSSNILTIDKGTDRWTGLYIEYNWLVDLTPYQGIKMDIKSPIKGLPLDVKIDDGNQKKIYSRTIDGDHWGTYSVEFKGDASEFNWTQVHSISIYVETSLLVQPLEIDNISFY